MQSRIPLRNVLTLLSGNGAAQLLSVAAIPLLTRLYIPADFALSGAFLSVVLTLAFSVNGGYDMAIMLPKEEAAARRLVRLCLRISAVICLSLLPLAILGAINPYWLIKAHLHPLAAWLPLLPVSIWLEGVYQPLQIALNRAGQYKALASSRVGRSLSTVGVSIVLGLTWQHFGGIILGYMAGQLVAVLIVSWQYRKLSLPILSDNHEPHSYGDFPRYAILSNWLNMAAKQLPLFVLPAWSGVDIAGLFERAQKVLLLPVGSVGMAFGDVFFRDASRPEADVAVLTRKMLRTLFSLAILPSIVVIWQGPSLFALVLGEPWREAGVYAQWLMPMTLLLFLSAPLGYLVDIRRKLKPYLWFNVANFGTQATTLGLVHVYFPLWNLVQVYSLVGAALLCAQLCFFLYIAGALKIRTFAP